jgi:ribosome-interacting GTPase 1
MVENLSFIDVLDFKKTKVFLREDDIVHVKLKAEQEITMDDFEEIINAVTELGMAQAQLIIFQAGYNSSVTPEVRKFASHPNANFLSRGDAIVVQSLAQRLMANFYIKFNRPSRPTKIFDNLDEAIAWLHKVKEGLQ